MDQVHVIRHKVKNEGLSQRQVALEMGVSRNTVRKYLGQSEPKYRVKQPRARPALERVKARLKELLEEWGERSAKKQFVTGTRLREQLRAEGLAVGHTLVREQLREWKRQRQEVYVPLEHRPGDEAQVDFFEVVVDVGDERRKVWMFLLRLMYSGKDFAWLYEHCDQVALLDGHARAFAHLGGVPSRLVYDNMKLAVSRILQRERKLTHAFQRLVSHYLFEPCFARPGTGHDKGGVESRGRHLRLQHLSPIPSGGTLAAISEELMQAVRSREGERRDKAGRSVTERFEQEAPKLKPLPLSDLDVRKPVPVEVSSRSLVEVEGATYSVPESWARLEAMAYIGPDEVTVACRGEQQEYPRQPRGGRIVKYRHYLKELGRKPNAVRQVAPELLSELGEPFAGFWKLLEQAHGAAKASRVLAAVLGAMAQGGEEPVRAALRAALADGEQDLLRLLRKLHPDDGPQKSAVPEHLVDIVVESTSASEYDSLLLAGAEL